MARLTILGIGYKPIDECGRKALSSCQSILGSKRLVEVFERYPEHETFREKIKRIDSVDKTMAFIHENLRSETGEIVLLGSGDPLFFGIGARAAREFGREAVEIIPDLTSLQWAFALVKEPWDDTLFISLHGGPDPEKRRKLKYSVEDLPRLVEANDTIGILTDRENDPPKIARLLIPEAVNHPSLQLFVGERMGYEDQRITKGAPGEIAAMSFAQPNVVIVKKKSQGALFEPQSAGPLPSPEIPPPLGLEENEISHSRGLITKNEIRAISLHALRLPQEGVFWDVGAGSGAISVEAGRLCPKLRVFSIEKDGEQLGHIERNRVILAARNISVVPGKAPSALSALPSPDRVFIGGSGGEMAGIVSVVGERMTSGVVVVNAATMETLNEALTNLETKGFSVRATEISIARLKPLGGKRHFASQNPIFVIVGEKRSSENVAGRVLL